MSTKLEIYNMAISASRGQGNLSSLTQKSREREECDNWYDLVVRVVQEAAFWPCCKSRAELTPRKGGGYILPGGYLRAWYLENLAPFEIVEDRVLHTRTEVPVLYYSRLVTDTSQWSPTQTQATIYGLASKIARSLVGVEGLVANLTTTANNHLQSAQSIALNSSGNYKASYLPPFLTARGYAVGRDYQYHYPYGDVFSDVT